MHSTLDLNAKATSFAQTLVRFFHLSLASLCLLITLAVICSFANNNSVASQAAQSSVCCQLDASLLQLPTATSKSQLHVDMTCELRACKQHCAARKPQTSAMLHIQSYKGVPIFARKTRVAVLRRDSQTDAASKPRELLTAICSLHVSPSATACSAYLTIWM